MNRRIRVEGLRLGVRLLAWALPLACLLPLSVSARVQLMVDGGNDGPAGDPLDTNDFGSGGGSGGGGRRDPDSPTTMDAGLSSPVIDGRRVMLIPIYQGGLLMFRLMIIEEAVVTSEAADAR